MTYCLAMRLDEGLVFGADTRTNAGVDYVTSYSKLHVFQPANDRVFVVLSAGNLATTQEVLNYAQRDIDNPNATESLGTVNYNFEAAAYLGRLSRAVQVEHADALRQSGVSGETSLIVGVQIAGQPHEIYLIYPQGNYISASDETPYLQVGESKYGKPMLDRLVGNPLSLADGARLALVSLDATMRSNVTVGPPFEIAIYPKDSFAVAQHMTLRTESPFYAGLRESWQAGLQQAFSQLPRFDWEQNS